MVSGTTTLRRRDSLRANMRAANMFFRKSRRSDPGPPVVSPPSPERPESSTSRRTSISIVSRLSRTNSLADEGEKGPLGLSLLYSPPDPKVDFIFVHGLGGDSVKTWSKPSLQQNYWPQDWLPQDSAFENVRVFTYGYKSDYSKGKKDCLNIHQNGKAFLEELSASPFLAGAKTRIVAVGHSLGGLVIKKACLLAKQDAQYEALANRFASIFFLATPHQDADSAKLLKNMLKIANERASVTDLGRNLSAIQVINDEFRHYSEQIELWSFYETQKMRRFSSPIVDPEAAVLGHREERQIPMNADHGSICKFETRLDPSYLVLRDALASTVENLTTAAELVEENQKNARINQARKYLGVPEGFEDDLAQAAEARLKDSCQWISEKSTYINWRNGDSRSGKILWVRGAAGTGKSILAGYIIDQLQRSSNTCSYFFFKRGDNSKFELSICLRTLAFQMALANPEILDLVLRLKGDGVDLDNIDERTLWKRIFSSGILTINMEPQYWVIDGLDECSGPSVLTEFIFRKIDQSSPLKILVTGRDSTELHKSFAKVRPGMLQILSILEQDTQSDLERLIGTKTRYLTVLQPDEMAVLAEKILAKSEGSFIWTVLVLRELSVFYSKKDIDVVLEQLPRGMDNLCKRALHTMSQGCRGNELAKAVLKWASCACWPMTVSELNYALNCDLEDSFPRLKDSITRLCGQFVVIDRYDRVQMIHEAAREALLRTDSGSEFDFEEASAHSRMAKVCLQYLVGDEMKPPSIGWERERTSARVQRMDFSMYALTAYSYHLSKSDARDKKLFELALQFTGKNILTWIEMVADSGDLSQLVKASQQFKKYIDTLCVQASYPDSKIQLLRQCAVDLERIATKFGHCLLASPSSIYSLIPSFCPPNSMIRVASKQLKTLEVLGKVPEQWDEKLYCLNFGPGQPTAICRAGQFFAVGFTTGAVNIYDTTSYREIMSFNHGEAVKFIRFDAKKTHLATCGSTATKVWDLGCCEILHSIRSPPCPLDMSFHNEYLLIASQKKYLQYWNLTKNATLESQKRWGDSMGTSFLPHPAPTALALSSTHKMLAVGYVRQPITIWDLDKNSRVGSCGKREPDGRTSDAIVSALVFNPNPALGLLAVAYLNGDLAILDPLANYQLAGARVTCHSLDVSPNGKLLAVGTDKGMIQVYDFRTLKLLYQTEASTTFAKQVSFMDDSMRFADLRPFQCTIWEPSASAQGRLHSHSDSAALTSTTDATWLDTTAKITALEVHDSNDIVFCGTEDGKISVYCRKTARCLSSPRIHNSAIRLLRWCRKKEALLSVDESNKIILLKILKSTEKGWQVDPMVNFQCTLDSNSAITDVLIGEAVDKFIVSTYKSDHLFSLGGNQEARKACKDRMGICKWMPHPNSPDLAIRLDGATARVYQWNDWSESWASYFSLSSEPLDLKSSTLCTLAQKKILLLELSEQNATTRSSNFMILNTDRFGIVHEYTGTGGFDEKRPFSSAVSERSTVSTSLPCPRTGHLTQIVSRIIGTLDTDKLVFVDHSNWMCSIHLGEGEPGRNSSGDLEYERHCFIPHEWFAAWMDVHCTIVQGDLVFARHNELAILKGCFDYTERIVFGKDNNSG